MKTGTVKFFNEAKGFGFITDDTTKEDFFVHITGLNGGQIQKTTAWNLKRRKAAKA